MEVTIPKLRAKYPTEVKLLNLTTAVCRKTRAGLRALSVVEGNKDGTAGGPIFLLKKQKFKVLQARSAKQVLIFTSRSLIIT